MPRRRQPQRRQPQRRQPQRRQPEQPVEAHRDRRDVCFVKDRKKAIP